MNTAYLIFKIAGNQVDLPTDEIPLSISFRIEEIGNFQQKQGSFSLDINLPPTNNNAKVFNSFGNASVMDMTLNKDFQSLMKCSISYAGTELFNGVSQLVSAGENSGYNLNIYANNSDWGLLLKDTTMQDAMNPTPHVFDHFNVQNSWTFDGNNIDQDYVYAPARYRRVFGSGYANDDRSATIMDLRPALFIYPIIYRAFNSIGYRLVSNFMDTPYFRRMVMPWTWGDFLRINSQVTEELKFYALGPILGGDTYYVFQLNDTSGHVGEGTVIQVNDPVINPDVWRIDNETTEGGFDNGDVYRFYGFGSPYNGAMEWTYKTVYGNQLGLITARFELKTIVRISCTAGSTLTLYADVYKNGVRVQIVEIANQATASGGPGNLHIKTNLITVTGINSGENVVIKLRYSYNKTIAGGVFIEVYSGWTNTVAATKNYSSLKLLSISIEPGGIVDWKQYSKFSTYKFLDMLRGVMDAFCLEPTTDSVTKTVYFEPTDEYWLNNEETVRQGHYINNRIDWNDKLDMNSDPVVSLFSDFEREYIFRFSDDGNDGGHNKYLLRNQVSPGMAMYRFPERFKKGQAEFENRFFGPVLHYEANQWKDITGVAPQLIAMIPENVSNASNNESESSFKPKLAWYKGLVDRNIYGGWKYQDSTAFNLPYMFAVNYKTGGQYDPVLTYCDQYIGNTDADSVIATGLMKRFFLRRLARMRNGKILTASFLLNVTDVTNWRHRERIIVKNLNWVLTQIADYSPLSGNPTECTFWMDWYIEQQDSANCFPSGSVVSTSPETIPVNDLNYKKLLLLTTDITK